MVNIRLLKIVIGFVFVFFGIFWIILDKYNCRKMCGFEPYPCIWLFLFIGIIFIVCGSVLLVRGNNPPEFGYRYDE